MYGLDVASGREGPAEVVNVRARELQHIISIRSKKRKEGTDERSCAMIAGDNGANRAEDEEDLGTGKGGRG